MPNRLEHASSPYLLQHANNPVDWYPWGEEALEKAQQENKLILVSIGYAACHWCHVMEHESFTDEEVAGLMNANFVCIKVDREERPDIDKTYMEAVQLMTGQGGWPLNCVALPDGRPIWGGTYFPKPRWMSALQQLATLYAQTPQEALRTAENVGQYMLEMGKVLAVQDPPKITQEDLGNLLNEWTKRIDFKWGGRKARTNKFPVPANYQFLIRAAHYTQREDVQQAVDITLEKMAFGGIYDHIGGGFARYSVDPYWKVPHFEKMLYDNGQLVSLYAEAYHQKPRDLYKSVVYHTLAFISRELTSPEGGFYSSLDADSEGEEGKYYVWLYEELEQILGEDGRLFADYYNAHPFGNWEGNNILFVLETEEAFAEQWNLDPVEFQQKMAEGREKLLQERTKRIRPGLDDKILCSWNALMLKGYVDAYRVFGKPSFLETARTNARFIKEKLSEGGKLFRNYKAGTRSINGFLDDYAFTIDAFLALYSVTFEEEWLDKATLHLEFVREHFSDLESPLFFYTSDEEEILVKRHMEVQDDVTPGSNSVLAHSLSKLGVLLHRPGYIDQSQKMLDAVYDSLQKGPDWHAVWAQFMLSQLYPQYEVVITGPTAKSLLREFHQQYFPNTLLAGAESSSKLPLLQNRFLDSPHIFVCQDQTCKLPVQRVEEAWAQIVA